MMPRLLESMVEEPPKEDSNDLTDDEVAQAVPTRSYGELAKLLTDELRRCPGVGVKAHERRRRGEDLFWRTRLTGAEPERVLVFKVNWLGG